MGSMDLSPYPSMLMAAPPVAGALLFAVATATLLTLVLLTVASALVALYRLAPRVRRSIEHRLPTDTGRVYAETLVTVERACVAKGGTVSAPDPRLQPPLLPSAVGEEVAHG